MADSDSVELMISKLLRASVLVAAGVIALGVLVLWLRGETGHGSTADVVSTFAADPEPAGPLDRTLALWTERLARGDGAAVIQLGVVLLLLTPIARVAATCFVFLRQGDRLLAAIAGVVLLVLALSASGLVMH